MRKILAICACITITCNVLSQTNTFPSSGNVGVGTTAPDAPLHIKLDGTRAFRIGPLTSNLSDYSTGGTGLLFSRPSDGAVGISGIFNYSDQYGSSRLAFATRDDLVFAAGGVNNYSTAPERLRISGTSGYVGVGTTNPAARLDIDGRILLDFSSPLSYGVSISGYQNIGGWSRGYGFRTSSGAELAAFGSFANNDNLNWAYIGTGPLAYSSPWMAFLPNGKIGIGTTNPDPYGWASKALTIQSAGADSYSALEALGTGQGSGAILLGTDMVHRAQISTSGGSHLVFSTNTNNSGTFFTEKMRITSSGNVGIGTANPQYRLQIGDATTQSKIQIASDNSANHASVLSLLTSGSREGVIAQTNGSLYIGNTGGLGGAHSDVNISNSAQISISQNAEIGLKTYSVQQNAPGSTYGYYQILTGTANGGGLFGVEGNTAGALYSGTVPWATVLGSTSSGTKLQFGTAGVVRATLDLSGNFGIGTTQPSKKLDVNGDIAISAYNLIGSGAAFGCAGCASSGTIELYNGATGNTTIQSGVSYKLLLNPTGGNVGIGTANPTEKLSVAGNIKAHKLKVTVAPSEWPDYVFKIGYSLWSLQTVDEYIKKYGHLPGVPSGTEVEKNGLDVGETQAVLLKKIEELTLYVIDLQKQVDELKKR